MVAEQECYHWARDDIKKYTCIKCIITSRTIRSGKYENYEQRKPLSNVKRAGGLRSDINHESGFRVGYTTGRLSPLRSVKMPTDILPRDPNNSIDWTVPNRCEIKYSPSVVTPYGRKSRMTRRFIGGLPNAHACLYNALYTSTRVLYSIRRFRNGSILYVRLWCCYVLFGFVKNLTHSSKYSNREKSEMFK